MNPILRDYSKKTVRSIFFRGENKLAEQLFKENKIPNGFDRIYHYHIRKTGGSSLNLAFFSSTNYEAAKKVHLDISKSRFNFRTISDKKVFVGWDKLLIEQGHYYYAFSHAAAHEIEVPPNSFCFTCLRDPVKRVISHYNMLQQYKENNTRPNILKKEGHWLGNSIDDFVEKMDKEHLLRQLYMFSKEFNVDEAAEKILNLQHYMFTEDFQNGIDQLGEKLNEKLLVFHEKKASKKKVISQQSIDKLNEFLELENRLIKILINHKNNPSN